MTRMLTLESGTLIKASLPLTLFFSRSIFAPRNSKPLQTIFLTVMLFSPNPGGEYDGVDTPIAPA